MVTTPQAKATMPTYSRRKKMQSFLIGLVGAVVLIGFYLYGWYVNNPWLFQ